jgi:hypothetical protein
MPIQDPDLSDTSLNMTCFINPEGIFLFSGDNNYRHNSGQTYSDFRLFESNASNSYISSMRDIAHQDNSQWNDTRVYTNVSFRVSSRLDYPQVYNPQVDYSNHYEDGADINRTSDHTDID